MALRFAVIADLHIGAFEHSASVLEELLWARLESVCDYARENCGAMFIAGDIFHSAAPGPKNLIRFVRLLREQVPNLTVFVVKGSHDSGTGEDDYLSVLDAAGVIKLLPARPHGIMNNLWACAVPGLRGGMETKTKLAKLETKKHNALFFFHTAIREALPEHLRNKIPNIKLSDLPHGYDMYIGGHLHWAYSLTCGKKAPVLSPGALVGSTFADLAQAERGTMLELKLHNSVWTHKTITLPGKPIVSEKVKLGKGETGEDVLKGVKRELRDFAKKWAGAAVVYLRFDGDWPEPYLSTTLVRAVLPTTDVPIIIDTSHVRGINKQAVPVTTTPNVDVAKRIRALADDVVAEKQAQVVFTELSVPQEPDEQKQNYVTGRVKAGMTALEIKGVE